MNSPASRRPVSQLRPAVLRSVGGAIAGLIVVLAAVAPRAQGAPAVRVFHVRDTMGIRRTEYPVTVAIQLPKGALKEAAQVRVMTNSVQVPAQFMGRSSWDDG